MFYEDNTNLELAKVEFDKILADLKNHIIPKSYPQCILNNPYERRLSNEPRCDVINEQGFALLSKDWISLLAKWIRSRKCVELMAGCGSLTHVLKEEGVDIIATDKFTWDSILGTWSRTNNYWTTIENIDCIDAVMKYPTTDIFIMSWPYMDDTAYKTLLKIREVNPNALLITIGEGYGGCTADDDFHSTMIEIDDDDEFNKISNLFRHWNYIHDELILVK